MGSEKTLTQEVAHPFYLNFGLLIIFRVGLQYMLNDNGIDSNDGLFEATYIEPECIAEVFGVLRQNLHRIAGHRARIRKGAKSRNSGN
jgi:hypothetical protein